MVYKTNSVTVDQTEFELGIEEFINVLRELDLLEKEALNSDKVKKMIKEAFLIQHDKLLFVEMLEILLDVTMAFPFSEEDVGTSRETKKMMYILDKVKAKNLSDAEKFKGEIEEARKTKSYVIRYLVPEQESLNTSHKGGEIEGKEGEDELEQEDDVDEEDK